METIRLGAVEGRFADIIWQNEPIPSGELVKQCEKELGWKKSTTYTVLKRLCERGIFKNEGGTVTSVISRADFYAMEGESVVERSYGGSLPAFIAAFGERGKLTDADIDALQALIDDYRKGRCDGT